MTSYTVTTKALLEADHVPIFIDALDLQGFAEADDGGQAQYRRVLAEPAHLDKIQSADGSWWEIAKCGIHIWMLGAKEDGEADATAALLNAHAIGRPLRLGAGRIRLASMVEITDHPPLGRHWAEPLDLSLADAA